MANGNNFTVWQNSTAYYFDPTTPIAAGMGTGYICIASGTGFQLGTYSINNYQPAYSAPGTNADGQNLVSLTRAKADGTQYTTGQLTPVSSVAVPPQSGAVWGWGATVAAAQTAAARGQGIQGFPARQILVLQLLVPLAKKYYNLVP